MKEEQFIKGWAGIGGGGTCVGDPGSSGWKPVIPILVCAALLASCAAPLVVVEAVTVTAEVPPAALAAFLP